MISERNCREGPGANRGNDRSDLLGKTVETNLPLRLGCRVVVKLTAQAEDGLQIKAPRRVDVRRYCWPAVRLIHRGDVPQFVDVIVAHEVFIAEDLDAEGLRLVRELLLAERAALHVEAVRPVRSP